MAVPIGAGVSFGQVMASLPLETAIPAASNAQSPSRAQSAYIFLCAALAAISTVLIVYSQTYAFAWDEGFHLLTAQLIENGKRPYIDFFFPQTALNAYWNALWMRAFGDSWRVSHAVAACLAAAATWLVADYIFVRFPIARWRFAAALAGAMLTGLNIAVIQFGTLGQGYAICMFLLVSAFRITTLTVSSRHIVLAALAGLLASASAGCSLLAAPGAPVLLVWMLVHNRSGNRLAKASAFILGAVIAAIPLLVLLVQSPQNVIFNVFKYHMFYREVDWSGALAHDFFEVLLAWTSSAPALLLGLLGFAGLAYLMFRSGWDRRLRAEFYLAAWLGIAICVHLSRAHPTFARYYLLTTPFLAILAAVGFYSVSETLYAPGRPMLPCVLLGFIMCASAASSIYSGKGDRSWLDMEKLIAKVNEVTPPQTLILGDEHIYFMTRRPPPSGMESEDSHKLNLAPELAAALHIIPKAELDRQLKAGRFGTVANCDDDDTNEQHGIPELFAHKEKIEECSVFWDFKKP